MSIMTSILKIIPCSCFDFLWVPQLKLAKPKNLLQIAKIVREKKRQMTILMIKLYLILKKKQRFSLFLCLHHRTPALLNTYFKALSTM
ncbi:hypothetical protein D1841_16690 [Neglecta sp. X4]|nr:hypothetical protein [Neglectibacter sp. 59]NBJ74795.1 hypothetical protein [Neglectibacter sp. X4]NCE82636.1 hypothetical protein [Neglectibacter sp. X58]